VTRGRLRAKNGAGARASATRRIPRRVESILIAATTSPSRERSRRGSRSVAHSRKGSKAFRKTKRSDDHGVLGSLRRREASPHSARSAVRGAGCLCSGRIGPCRTQPPHHPPPALPAAGSDVASQAASEKRRPSVSHSGRTCNRSGTAPMVLAWLAARLLSKGRGLRIACHTRRKARVGSEGQRIGAGGYALPPRRARIGRSRSCSRVVVCLQKSTDSGRRREADALHLTRFGGRSGTGA